MNHGEWKHLKDEQDGRERDTHTAGCFQRANLHLPCEYSIIYTRHLASNCGRCLPYK